MIHFKKVRWKNFLSTGNVFTEILLDKTPNTLIIGENGAGKSTILDALCFGLFGKAFRNIPRPLLVNSVNQKGLQVEVEFDIGPNEYKIMRGQKKYGSSPFEIHKNGELINQEANARDYQAFLEEHILKLNFRSFTQIVVLGNSSFIPFMQLKTADRRDLIEDLLDIKIFSHMSTLLKDKVSESKDKIKDIDATTDKLDSNIDMQREHIAYIKSNKESQLDQLKEQINDSEKKINFHEENIQESFVLSEQKRNSIKDVEEADGRLRKIQSLEDQLENKRRTLRKELTFYEQNDTCPTCTQTITEDFKRTSVEHRSNKIEEIDKALGDLTDEFEKATERVNKIASIQEEVQSLQQAISEENVAINHLRSYVKETEEAIKGLESDRSDLAKENKKLAKLEGQKNKSVSAKQEIVEELALFDVASNLLKDQGIKQRIVRQYIPIINKLVNKYLAAMDFFVNFQLDEKFTEKIMSRHRDAFTYDSFSEGEKMRIDLALLFTWRTIAKMKNSANTNLLILDEVFDASLDNNGCDEFLKLIHDLDNANVFVISHKGDILQDKFYSSIRFEKHKNFSRIAA